MKDKSYNSIHCMMPHIKNLFVNLHHIGRCQEDFPPNVNYDELQVVGFWEIFTVFLLQ